MLLKIEDVIKSVLSSGSYAGSPCVTAAIISGSVHVRVSRTIGLDDQLVDGIRADAINRFFEMSLFQSGSSFIYPSGYAAVIGLPNGDQVIFVVNNSDMDQGKDIFRAIQAELKNRQITP